MNKNSVKLNILLFIQQQSAHHKEKLEQADKDMNKNDNENSENNKSKSLKPAVDPLQNDWRNFECNTWHLEPTVIQF